MCEFCHQVTFYQRWILTLLIIGIMTAGPIQIELANMWCVDLIVALPTLMTGDEILQLISND